MLPHVVSILNFNIITINIFITLSIFCVLFVYWYEMKKDGFDSERVFDLFFIALIIPGALSRLSFILPQTQSIEAISWHIINFWLSGYNYLFFAVSFVFTVVFLCQKWKWSYFRVLDIWALSVSLGLSVFYLGRAFTTSEIKSFALFVFYFVVFMLFQHLRAKYRSGFLFSLFMFSHFFVSLQLYFLLITIGLVVLYYREKKNPMKTKFNLTKDFIVAVKKKLTREEKRLDAEQKLLIEEDPYLAEGRSGESEYLDDVQEDIAKLETDLRLSNIKLMKMSVRKALAKVNLGTYGYCEVCKGQISPERLKAYPEATTCVEHAD